MTENLRAGGHEVQSGGALALRRTLFGVVSMTHMYFRRKDTQEVGSRRTSASCVLGCEKVLPDSQ